METSWKVCKLCTSKDILTDRVMAIIILCNYKENILLSNNKVINNTAISYVILITRVSERTNSNKYRSIEYYLKYNINQYTKMCNNYYVNKKCETC